MKIKKVEIQNFYSFKKATLFLPESNGITLIDGYNDDTKGSNGAGKSVLIEAVYFGLTGKTIRKSTDEALVNNQEKKKCQIELFLDDGVRIFRQKKPTKLKLFIDGEDKTQHTVFDTQKLIDDRYKTNHKVLLSSMFFGQSNDVSFLESSAEDKRNIIKHFLALDEIFEMRDNIKKHKAAFYQGMKEQDSKTDAHKNTIVEFKDKIDRIQKAKKQFSEYGDEIMRLSLEAILDGEKHLSELDWRLSAIDKEVHALQDRKEHLEYKISNPNAVELCDMCSQALPKEPKEVAAEELLSVIAEIKEYKRVAKLEEQSRCVLPITSKEFSKVLAFKELCRDETNYSGLIQSFNEKIEESASIKAANKINYEVMRFWEKALSQQGVIKYIIKNVLDYLNDRINYYLSFLTNSKYVLKFNKELNEEVKANGRIVQYISLSGGEKRKVNLAVTLALKDLLLLTDCTQPNLLFFDEIAENLDEEGITGLYGLLQEIKKKKKIFVITHNKILKSLLYSTKKITVIKKKGISRIKK